MGILLEAGADVDALAPCDPWDFDHRSPVYSSAFTSDFSPPGLHTTIIESVFYRHPHFFNQILRYSKVRQGQLSQARLLQVAVEGCGALRAYLQTLTADTSEVNWHLESCLAKAFSLKAKSDSIFIGRRIQLIHNLLLSGVDPRLPSICGVLSIQSMLNILILWGRESIVEQNEPLPQCFIEVTGQLLRHGALWDEVDWENTIPRDSLGILPMLTSLGADFKTVDGSRALCGAAVVGNLEAMRWLLNAGADYGARLPVDICGNSLVRLLHRALCTYLYWEGKYPRVSRDSSDNPYLGMIEVILSLGPDLRYPQAGDPDLLEACFLHYDELGDETECCLAAFELLLDHGAPVSSPALAALVGLGGESDLVSQLIHKSSDVHGYAIERDELLIDRSGGIGDKDQAFSPVQAAVYRQNREQIILLLEKGADINQPAFNDRGVTALQAACQIKENPGGRLSMVKFLLELGADADGPPAQKNGLSALQIAAANGDLEIALMLLDRGADPNKLDTAQRRAGRTALDFAADYGRLDMLQLLLTVGGRSGSPGRTGVDGAIELAREDRCYAIVKYLEDHAKSKSGSSPDWIHNRFSQLDGQFGYNDITQTF
ncbi:unnamed protein product [Clonostachys rhizophaga]|uniref:Uncharacterized protein n=1 Tax=Clonostachys rhizophaga TaxID=160324 RepID=A0A9N9YKU7_9HYPO|nr:unnamed protein product [Clonostachys rhizophaga]